MPGSTAISSNMTTYSMDYQDRLRTATYLHCICTSTTTNLTILEDRLHYLQPRFDAPLAEAVILMNVRLSDARV